MNVCFYFSDKFIFPLFEGAFLFLFIYALLHEKGFLRKHSNLKMSVERGKEGWGNFTLAFGIASIVLMQRKYVRGRSFSQFLKSNIMKKGGEFIVR